MGTELTGTPLPTVHSPQPSYNAQPWRILTASSLCNTTPSETCWPILGINPIKKQRNKTTGGDTYRRRGTPRQASAQRWLRTVLFVLAIGFVSLEGNVLIFQLLILFSVNPNHKLCIISSTFFCAADPAHPCLCRPLNICNKLCCLDLPICISVFKCLQLN